MTDQDRPRFAELLLTLGEIFEETVSDLRAEMYFRALSDLPLEQIERGIVQAARTMTFFPKPAELLTLVQGYAANDEELAWLAVIRQVREVGSHRTPAFTDPAILKAIESAFTSWKRLCERLPLEGPQHQLLAKQFKTLYAIHRKQEEESGSARLIDANERFKGLLS